MTSSEAMHFISGFRKSGKPVKDLSRIKALLDALGNPQDHLKVVHIAGTNGKGSVVAFCAAATMAGGFCTGTFTSPFVRHYRDRIRVNGQDIPEEALCRLCEKVKSCHVSPCCSQFEITFAIGLLWFVERSCDIVFLETGLGGLLDATNIVQNPLVCVITSISYDHMDILGDTLEEIAAQKAGIIKLGCPVVFAPDNRSEVACVIAETAAQKRAPLVIPSEEDCRIISEDLTGTVFSYHSFEYTLAMPGRHQVINALTAIEVIRFLGMHGYLISAAVTKDAFAKVRVPGRVQQLPCSNPEDPVVIVDGGHNLAGILALSDVIRDSGKSPVYAICGMMGTKDYRTACGVLRNVVDYAFCVDDFISGAVASELLVQVFDGKGKCFSGILDAYAEALNAVKGTNGMVVVCGSLYLVSRFLELTEGNHEQLKL